MESPNKRLKQSVSTPAEAEDFVPLGGDDEEDKAAEFGYDLADGSTEQDNEGVSGAPRAPRAMREQEGHHRHSRNAWNDPRNAKDRPKSKHLLPGYEPWILVKTKFGRRFAHKTDTKESFWYIPQDVMPGVRAFEQWEREKKEKEANAKWAEEQLRDMREKSKAEDINKAADKDVRNRRRRSESLQREDEAAMLAELAAEAERGEEQDVKEVVKNVEPLKPVTQQDGGGYDSESSYEEVEVTDSEFEDDEGSLPRQSGPSGNAELDRRQDDAPVEFGEDDIAYQLAAMGEEYDIDQGDVRDEEMYDDDYEDDPAFSAEDAANLFRDMLDDHKISAFTPWDRLIADESDSSIIMDDRYTVLPNTRTRKEVWEAWVKDTAARLKEERARMEKLDPRIPYLAFLAENATPKLYWPEFKRKFKKDSEMNDRKLSDKDREKLYRDHIARLKLPESTRKADLIALLKSIPLAALNRSTSVDALPQQLLSHLSFISLPSTVRDPIVAKHISTLPYAPEGEYTEDQRAEEDAKREERRRRENALEDRKRKVEEDRRKAQKEEGWARRDLREEERELRKAMDVGNRSLTAQ